MKDPDEPYKTEPCTPTHHASPSHTQLASSKSDPTPLNSVLGSPKQIFDDTSIKRPVQKVQPSRNYSPSHTPTSPSPILNGNGLEYNGKNGTSKYIHDYVKPKSPIKNSTGIMSHDNVPNVSNGKSSPRLLMTSSGFINGPTNGTVKNANGVKLNRNISWNRDIPPEKINFTMRREFDKAKEESDLIDQLRNVIEMSMFAALQ